MNLNPIPEPYQPHRKISAGALAGGLSIIIVWAVKEFMGHTIPGEVASGITTVITFITAYIVPNAGE